MSKKETGLSPCNLCLISYHNSIYRAPCCKPVLSFCIWLCAKQEDKIRPRQHSNQPALHSSYVVMTRTISSGKHSNLYLIDKDIRLPSPSSLPHYSHPSPALSFLYSLSHTHTNTHAHKHTKKSFIQLVESHRVHRKLFLAKGVYRKRMLLWGQ